MAKGKGGTGRGTDRKGWTRWDKSAKAKSAVKVFGKGKGKGKPAEAGKSDGAGGSGADGVKGKS